MATEKSQTPAPTATIDIGLKPRRSGKKSGSPPRIKPRTWYTLHRWIAGIVGLQLLAWTLGGIIFSWHPIAAIRGSDAVQKAKPSIDPAAVRITLMEASRTAGIGDTLTAVSLRPLLDGVVYELHAGKKSAIVDATTGAMRSPVSAETARQIALAERRQTVNVLATTLLRQDPPAEYRGRPLPAWQIMLADEGNTHIYVDANTGRITAHRNDIWRRFDWFWMLHTMDYGGRDDFHTPWLQAMAWLTLLGLLSGYGLWLLRLRRRKR